MANELTRVGYGQVEPNHLSAQRTGQIFAQLPAASGITTLENGTFLKYDMEAGECNFTGDGEWMLVMNEVKLYNPLYMTMKDFALVKTDFMGGAITPRLYKTNVGDIFTTNCVKQDSAGLAVVGAKLVVGTTGVLEVNNTPGTAMWFNVVKVTTMPDGQAAVKLQRIQ